MGFPSIALILLGAAWISPVQAQDLFTVQATAVPDQKAVFATVESRRTVPARARISGSVARLVVKEGNSVTVGQVVATVYDEKLALQMKSLDAQIAGLQAQMDQAETDLKRAEDLFSRGIAPRTRLDEARTAFNVADNTMRARVAERSVVQQQLTEGDVLAPAAGRVLRVPLTAGTVIVAGETVAEIAEENFVLRLRVPERHAGLLKSGDSIRVDTDELGEDVPQFGTIQLVYPQIEDGRVVADAAIKGLGDYFVNKRVRVWISAGSRNAIVIPASFITTRFGVDYVQVLRDGAATIDTPIQRGRELPRPDLPDGIEVLSGLRADDRLVKP